MTSRCPYVRPRSSPVDRLPVFLLLVSLVGCSDDPKAELDKLVDRVWMEEFPHLEAVAFLETGGTHYDIQHGRYENVDREHVIPLLKGLARVTNLEPVAFVDEDLNWAWALIIRFPPETSTYSSVQTLVEEADCMFPGIIETEWGHRHLRLSFVDETEG